ncbi:hypothetical protein A2U01_0106695, partial [Trifolium medium]|nr:hypothetical protein [Trifolium medium]
MAAGMGVMQVNSVVGFPGRGEVVMKNRKDFGRNLRH